LIMPVNPNGQGAPQLSQQQQYAKGGLGRWYWDWRDRATLAYIEPSDRRIVDLGCGEGITLQRLVTQFPGREIMGIDVMPENIAICAARQLPARLGDLYALDLANDSQDVAVLLEVIEHLQHPERALREAYRILRPGGKLLILFPNDLVFLLARLLTLRFKEAFFDPGHLRQWTPAQIIRALSTAGFHTVTTRNIPLPFWPCAFHGLVVGIKIV
jgi:ubiquinone/menaquinone biosynthesis C-methylase UbiE